LLRVVRGGAVMLYEAAQSSLRSKRNGPGSRRAMQIAGARKEERIVGLLAGGRNLTRICGEAPIFAAREPYLR